jgi:IPT/TIG domain-containing protein
MQISDIKNPNERKKLIGAGVLGLVAVILLWWTFFGFGTRTTNKVSQRPVPVATASPVFREGPTAVDQTVDVLDQLRPINAEYTLPAVPEARRNIFVYYEKPPAVVSLPPSPTPTPIPPVLLASVSPATVYARTDDFTLEVSGDKFTSQLRVLIDNSPLPTRYRGPQQVSVTVPAALIANPGSRQVTLRNADGTLYSNPITLNIAAPPIPNFSYVGIIGTRRYIDTAILQDKSNREMLNVQRGDLLGGRFRVTSISEKEIVLVDANLKIKHAIPLTSQGDRGGPLQRPTPKVESEDDEP